MATDGGGDALRSPVACAPPDLPCTSPRARIVTGKVYDSFGDLESDISLLKSIEVRRACGNPLLFPTLAHAHGAGVRRCHACPALPLLSMAAIRVYVLPCAGEWVVARGPWRMHCLPVLPMSPMT